MFNKIYEKVYEKEKGYYELKQKPSQAEIEQFYRNEYHQQIKGSNDKTYSREELDYNENKLAQNYKIVGDILKLKHKSNKRFLDIGCGEGWTLQYFKSNDWEVTGLDYSDYGCRRFNPNVIDNLIVGDIYQSINKLIKDKQQYDCMFLFNVLEHVLDPLCLLQKCRELLSEDGLFVVKVPNDFSELQQHLVKSKKVNKAYWICTPDHISYFNKDGLQYICEQAGFTTNKLIADFPIDLLLFNEDTNYVNNRQKGSNCHKQRIAIENFIHEEAVKKANNLYESLSDLGLGRNLTAFLTKK